MIEATDKRMKEGMREVKIHSIHWTFGRYDAVVYSEAPDEKAAFAGFFDVVDRLSTETLVAIPREEALKAVGLR